MMGHPPSCPLSTTCWHTIAAPPWKPPGWIRPAGFLHQLRSGRPSLALDLAEELRPMADRFVLSLINKKQLVAKGFETWPNGSVTLKEEPLRTLLAAWQYRKQDILSHPWFEEKVPVGLLPWLQAQIFARHLRGDCDS